MQKINVLLFLALGAFSFLACSDDNEELKAEASLSLKSNAPIVAQAEKFEKVIEIVTNQEIWDAISGDQTWCHVAKNKNTLIVTLDANMALEARETKIKVTAGTGATMLTEELKVSQFGVAECQLSLEVDALQLEAEENSVTTYLFANQEEDITVSTTEADTWCTVAVTREGKKSTVTVTGAANTSVKARETKIYFSLGKGEGMAKDTLVVTQQGLAVAELSVVDILTIDEQGTAQEVKIATNQTDFSFSTLETVEWCTIKKVDNKLQISATANTETSVRKVKIAIQAGIEGNMAYDTLTVQQVAKAEEVIRKMYEIVKDASGKAIGIVIKVTDGGKHGLMMSLNKFTTKDVMKDNSVVGLLNENDGMANYEVLKKQSDFPAAYPAWQEVYDREQKGDLGWYVPAINELIDLFTAYNGGSIDMSAPDFPDPGMAKKDKRAEFNKLLTDNGGKIIVDGEEWWDCPTLISSTESNEMVDGKQGLIMRMLHFGNCNLQNLAKKQDTSMDSDPYEIRLVKKF